MIRRTCSTWCVAFLKVVPPAFLMESATSSWGRYPTSPTAKTEDVLTFITCTQIGVALREEYPVPPPSQDKFIKATLAPAGKSRHALRNTNPCCTPAPYNFSFVLGCLNSFGCHCNSCLAAWSRLQCRIHTKIGSTYVNVTESHPGIRNWCKHIFLVRKTLSQKFPACRSAALRSVRLHWGHLCPQHENCFSPNRVLTAESTLSWHWTVSSWTALNTYQNSLEHNLATSATWPRQQFCICEHTVGGACIWCMGRFNS